MKVLIDTNILISYIRHQKKNEDTIYYKLIENDINCYISSITRYELQIGNLKDKKIYEILIDNLNEINLSSKIIDKSIDLQRELIRLNKKLEDNDIFIASTAIVHKLPLVTYNTTHFERIEELELFDLSDYKGLRGDIITI